MKRFNTPLIGFAIASLLLASSSARADLVAWSYNWTPSVSAVLADNAAGGGKITLTNEPAGSAVGDSDIVATNLKSVSTASPNAPDTFTNKTYSLALTLTDIASHQSGTLTFQGAFNGSISSASANVTNSAIGATAGSLVLGGNSYSVSINSYVPPPPPTATNSGSIGATALVTVSQVSRTPEPSTMVMAGLGLSFLGLLGWKKRREGRNQGVGAA
jgi:hypothetical protein